MENLAPGQKIIEVDSCTVHLAGKQLLAPLSLSFSAGDFLSICGPSGSGKSTLLQLLLGFIFPSRGSYRLLEGKAGWQQIQRLRQMSYCIFQGSQLPLPHPDASALEALLHPFSFRAKRSYRPSSQQIQGSLDKLGFPHLDLEQAYQRFSGGERQALALALALCLPQRILFLDEACSALDRPRSQRVQELLMSEAYTVLAISHDPAWLESSPQVLELA